MSNLLLSFLFKFLESRTIAVDGNGNIKGCGKND
jgi:hypothetical protein